jgi:integrase
MFDHFSPEWRAATEAFFTSLYERSGSEDTLLRYQSILLQAFAEKTPEQLTRADVLSYLPTLYKSRRNYGRTTPIAPATKNIRLCCLVSFYRWCSNWLIPGTETFLFVGIPPTQGITYSKLGTHYRALDEDELKAFFAAIPDTIAGARDRSLFIAYFLLARRRSEIFAMKFGDIQQDATIVDEKGNRHKGMTYTFRGKGRKRTLDTQEMPPEVWRAILDYLEKSGRLETITPDDYVWKSTSPGIGQKGSVKGSIDGGPLNPDTVNLKFKAICQAAGIAGREGLSLHSFRHSSILHRYAAGEDLLSLKRLLRHSNLATTDTYLHALVGTADPGAARLAQKFAFLR